MTLASGARIGPYEIVELFGAGGMGEEYRARNGKLNRDMALKVLPEAFVLDPDRLARSKCEGQVLASLHDPNIAAIYGFEDSHGVQVLVLEPTARRAGSPHSPRTSSARAAGCRSSRFVLARRRVA
jgi:serine/threonine protein kinase